MTNVQKFIELAIEGGWKVRRDFINEPIEERAEKPVKIEIGEYTETFELWWTWENDGGQLSRIPIHKILLDPLAWQAVGKAKGWRDDVFHESCAGAMHNTDRAISEAEINHARFVSELWRGKSIEEALAKTLE